MQQTGIIDSTVKDALLRFPTADLIALVFPNHPVRQRGVMRSPFRDDRSPSFSCFRGRNGISMWKDHSTGEGGDNIAFYRKAFPSLSYPEAVDSLSLLVLGRSACVSRSADVRPVRSVRTRMEPEEEGALRIVSDRPLTDPSLPEPLRLYWRGRGISDATMYESGCRYVVFENRNVAGSMATDPGSGLPLLDGNGNVERRDGRRACIGLRNDIGGFSLREPDVKGRRGFKGCSSSFITTLVGGRPLDVSVSFRGEGGGLVSFVRYDDGCLWINPRQCFTGVGSESLKFACPFVYGFLGRCLSMRDVRCMCAVLSSLSAAAGSRAVCVEGMFDGLSVGELDRLRGVRGRGDDLVILNSVANMRWAVPFLCRHASVSLLFDNDMLSGAGQRAMDALRREIAGFCLKAGVSAPVVFDASQLFRGYKDINDALMADKGFSPAKTQQTTKGRARVKL